MGFLVSHVPPGRGWENNIPSTVRKEKVQGHLMKLNLYKSMRPDNRHLCVLRKQADVLAKTLSIMFGRSVLSDVVSGDQRKEPGHLFLRH